MNATSPYESSILERLLISSDLAQAVMALRFSPTDEERMRELMEKNNQGLLSPEEKAEMEAFRRVGTFLGVLKARAQLQLQRGDQPSAA